MKKLMMMAVAALLVGAAAADEENYGYTPVQLNLISPLGLPMHADTVGPLRVNLIYGSAPNVWGVDIGLINHSGHKEMGYRDGFVNWGEDFYGVSFGLINVDSMVVGAEVGIINYATKLHGLQIGLVNIDLKSLLPVLPIINFGF